VATAFSTLAVFGMLFALIVGLYFARPYLPGWLDQLKAISSSASSSLFKAAGHYRDGFRRQMDSPRLRPPAEGDKDSRSRRIEAAARDKGTELGGLPPVEQYEQYELNRMDQGACSNGGRRLADDHSGPRTLSLAEQRRQAAAQLRMERETTAVARVAVYESAAARERAAKEEAKAAKEAAKQSAIASAFAKTAPCSHIMRSTTRPANKAVAQTPLVAASALAPAAAEPMTDSEGGALGSLSARPQSRQAQASSRGERGTTTRVAAEERARAMAFYDLDDDTGPRNPVRTPPRCVSRGAGRACGAAAAAAGGVKEARSPLAFSADQGAGGKASIIDEIKQESRRRHCQTRSPVKPESRAPLTPAAAGSESGGSESGLDFL